MPQDHPTHDVCVDISHAVVHFHKSHLGRGPVRVETHWAGPDVLVCVLRDSLTTLERTLVEAGSVDQVRDLRRTINDGGREELVAAVSAATGRQVVTVVTGLAPENDTSAKVFVLGDELSA